MVSTRSIMLWHAINGTARPKCPTQNHIRMHRMPHTPHPTSPVRPAQGAIKHHMCAAHRQDAPKCERRLSSPLHARAHATGAASGAHCRSHMQQQTRHDDEHHSGLRPHLHAPSTFNSTAASIPTTRPSLSCRRGHRPAPPSACRPSRRSTSAHSAAVPASFHLAAAAASFGVKIWLRPRIMPANGLFSSSAALAGPRISVRNA